jgi:phosphopantetheinyl transferase (holo-ACP synthase)
MSQCARRGGDGAADKCLEEDKREIAREMTRSIAGRFAAAEAVKDDRVRGSAAAATGDAMP